MLQWKVFRRTMTLENNRASHHSETNKQNKTKGNDVQPCDLSKRETTFTWSHTPSSRGWAAETEESSVRIKWKGEIKIQIHTKCLRWSEKKTLKTYKHSLSSPIFDTSSLLTNQQTTQSLLCDARSCWGKASRVSCKYAVLTLQPDRRVYVGLSWKFYICVVRLADKNLEKRSKLDSHLPVSVEYNFSRTFHCSA